MQQALACARYLEVHGVPYFDREIGRTTSRNKLSQMVMLQSRGLPVPTTLFARNRRRLVRLLTTTYKDEFTWPVIAKATGGTRGDANYLLRTPDELTTLLESEHRHFLIQSFIPNDGDYRALVIGDKLRGLIKRVGVEGSHLNNTSKDGQAEWLPRTVFTPEQRLLAVRAAQLFGRDVAGVDVLFDKHTGQPYILEVNRAPQIEDASYPEQKAAILAQGITEAIREYEQPAEPPAEKTIGVREYVSLPAFPLLGRVIAKVDTGAYSNTMHVEYVEEKTDAAGNRTLSFSPTRDKREVYTTTDYFVKRIVSSNGIAESRYVVTLAFTLGDTTYSGQVTLSDRGTMRHPVLIGRKFLRRHRFVVNPKRRFTL